MCSGITASSHSSASRCSRQPAALFVACSFLVACCPTLNVLPNPDLLRAHTVPTKLTFIKRLVFFSRKGVSSTCMFFAGVRWGSNIAQEPTPVISCQHTQGRQGTQALMLQVSCLQPVDMHDVMHDAICRLP